MAWPISLFSSAASQQQAAGSSKQPEDLNARLEALSPAIQELLKHFEAPGVAPPPSARVGDPKLKQRESQPIKLWHWWRYGAFVAMKGKGTFSMYTPQ